MIIKVVTGNEIGNYITELARLRITVFNEFPYLYKGSEVYEEEYLSTYLKSQISVFVLALDNEAVVGAASGMPLIKETVEVQKPFIEHNINPKDVFYFGESVLLKQYRGQGIGKIFMQERENHAIKHKFSITAFCGVIRADNHPRKPSGFRPLDTFWMNYGYQKQPEMVTEFIWQDLDEKTASPKKMMFWLKKHPLAV